MPYGDTMSQGERIREARQAKGLTQQDLADALGVQRAAVSQWEKDQTSPTNDKLAKLSEMLSVDVQHLVTGTRRLPVARIPLNTKEQQLSVIEQAAKMLAPLAKDRSPAMMALLLQEWLSQLEPPEAEGK